MGLANTAPDARLNATLDMLERLVGFDTESSKSNLGLVAFVEDYFKSLGVAYTKIPNATGDKAALLRQSARTAMVALSFPGTPMLSLSRAKAGQAILSRCAGTKTAFMAAAPAI